MTYVLQNDQGRTLSNHVLYKDAVAAAEEFAGDEGVVGHDGDIIDGGDKTLVWSDEDSSLDDAGANAIGSIRIV